MGDLAEHIAQRARAAIEGLSKDERADAYVVSFFVYNEDDDPRRPTLTIGTNTETSVLFASSPPPDFVKPNIWWTPTDEGEARWNFAFWQKNALDVIGDSVSDPIGTALRDKWFDDLGIPIDIDIDWASLDHGTLDELEQRWVGPFVDACVESVRGLDPRAPNLRPKPLGLPMYPLGC